MRLKYKVNFYPEKRKNKDGNLITEDVPVFIFFSYTAKRLQYYTGYRLDLNQWNTETQRMRPNTLNKQGISSAIINKHLDDLKTSIEDIYMERWALKKKPTIEYLRDELKKRMGEDKTDRNFFDTLDLFIKTASVTNS